MNQFELAQAYVTTLTGSPDSVIDWRCIHDTRKDLPAHTYRGTLTEHWQTLCDYNANGYGVFCNINAMDGRGNLLENVQFIRAHVVDLDDAISARANYDRAVASNPQPSFGVQTSPGKFHLYWLVEPYTGNDFYTLQQRKIRQFYDGDRSVIDPTRVLRVPGFYHLKGEPYLVNCWMINNGPRITAAQIEQAFAHINIIDNFGGRHPLGDPAMQAPSLEWLEYGLKVLDPNSLDRAEWLSVSAAIKQSGWNLTDEGNLEKIWNDWCARYTQNDTGENTKLWKSIRDTEVGWSHITRKCPALKAQIDFGGIERSPPVMSAPSQQSHAPPVLAQPMDTEFTEILDVYQCQKWFKNCFFVNRMGEIFSQGRFLNSTQFNGMYGGKQFIISTVGKTTDEPWKAALRSTVWTIPKVDHVRFLPDRPLYDIIIDGLGRSGLNTYIPPRIDARPGDVSLWLQHVAKILPDPADQKLFLDYLAHAIKYPGFKIPWAPLLQSAEGVGKTVFFEVIKHALGDMYVYSPQAQELVASGSKFNAWMRGKLMIVVNEIRVDERRELIEILKPMITDAMIEVQSKGVDQEMEDNPANWLFFSNYPDAIPITKNGRRYAIFYSAIQNARDLALAGMDQEYFVRLWRWLRDQDGYAAITYWFQNYPIERGAISVRAPQTTSYERALRNTRSPMEVVISDCVEDAMPGFRGGYVSTLAVINRCKQNGIRQPSPRSVQTCLEGMGYVEIGRSPRAYAQESVESKSILYSLSPLADPAGFGRAQGYE